MTTNKQLQKAYNSKKKAIANGKWLKEFDDLCQQYQLNPSTSLASTLKLMAISRWLTQDLKDYCSNRLVELNLK